MSSSATAPMLDETVPSGLADKIECPQLKAFEGGRRTLLGKRRNHTTGQIFSCKIICNAVIPSSFGMLMSIETTSGRSSLAFATASSPSRASTHQIEVGRLP